MDTAIGDALARFEAGLQSFRRGLDPFPEVATRLFEGTDDWTDLLTYKLVPHLAGEGCLVAAFAGGTNTGKSTVFNLLLGQTVSPVVNTAAATCRPLIAANARRYAECLESKLVPEFRPIALTDPNAPVDRTTPASALYVAKVENLPDHLVVMDTPDVDSIDKQHWEIADHIRAAGDVIVAVVTGEKYKDDRVVEFFREAVQSGRVVVPLMNKAQADKEFEVARQQLDDFCKDIGTEGPCFLVAYDPNLAANFEAPIRMLDGDETLRHYLETQDVPAIKRRVFRTTVLHFADRAGQFLDNVADQAARAKQALADFDAAAKQFAQTYDPAPGEAVGGLFHDFVQSKRGPVRKAIGATSAAVVRTTSAVSRGVTRAFRRRATLEGTGEDSPTAHYEQHKRIIEGIVRDLAAGLIERARTLDDPLRGIALTGANDWNVDAAVDAVVKDALKTNDVSKAFREHAHRTLETWWNDHKGRRRVLEALDVMLAAVPAAIAAPIAMHTGGIGAPEAAIAIGPIAAQFVTRVMEMQFGDAMFDFLSPWKKEQQAGLEQALRNHVVAPIAGRVRALSEILDGETAAQLRKAQQTCLKA